MGDDIKGCACESQAFTAATRFEPVPEGDRPRRCGSVIRGDVRPLSDAFDEQIQADLGGLPRVDGHARQTGGEISAVLHAIAKKTIERKSGARGLRSVVEELLIPIMYEIPSDPTIIRVVIDEDTVESGKPHLEYGAVRKRYKNQAQIPY